MLRPAAPLLREAGLSEALQPAARSPQPARRRGGRGGRWRGCRASARRGSRSGHGEEHAAVAGVARRRQVRLAGRGRGLGRRGAPHRVVAESPPAPGPRNFGALGLKEPAAGAARPEAPRSLRRAPPGSQDASGSLQEHPAAAGWRHCVPGCRYSPPTTRSVVFAARCRGASRSPGRGNAKPRRGLRRL